MGGEDAGDAGFAVQALDQVDHLAAGLRIEVGRGFIGDQQARRATRARAMATR
jgi:hypothetical protein